MKYKLTKQNGVYTCDPIISKEQWLTILDLADTEQHRKQLDILLMFYRKTEHKSTCKSVGVEYSLKPNSVNALITNFCRFAKKKSGIEFTVEQDGSNEETFWPIAMIGKELPKGLFEWQVRPELAAALKEFLIQNLLKAYRQRVIAQGLDNEYTKERYKWEVTTSLKGKDTKTILEAISSADNSMNLLTWRTKDSIRDELKNQTETIITCFEKLLQEKTFEERFHEFKEFGKSVFSANNAQKILNERTAALFLACSNPETDAIYKPDLYKLTIKYLGLQSASNLSYPHYLDILKEIAEYLNNDHELIEKLRSETSGLVWSDLLNAQDVLWQMQSYMESSMPTNWIQQMYNEAIEKKDGTFTSWYPQYVKSFTMFLEMFEDGKKPEEIPDDTLRYFISAGDNYISSNLQGTYSASEYDEIVQIWPELFSIFKKSISTGKIDMADYNAAYDLLDSITYKISGKHRPAAFHRLWAGIFPDLLTTVIKDDRFKKIYKSVHERDDSLRPPTGDWLEDNIAFMEYLRDKVKFIEPRHRALLAWYIHENLPTQIKEETSDMEKYINLLENNHNLILTGAPGTGKTYLAKQIAMAMGDSNPGFVQFHPSYDYTDFVEGLRPNASGGFERKNGKFKQFCADAIAPMSSSNFNEAYEKLVSDIEASEKPMTVMTAGSNSPTAFAISVNNRGNLDLLTGKEQQHNGSLTKERIQDCDNQIYWRGYYKGVMQLLIDKYGLKQVAQDVKTKHVFIIDEINRGELSKIFGELFFAIEPGYRGVKGKVSTQYQNLVDAGDPFYDGFYIPENVYIIGTMNDIDRGVESMDFAIRRRFAWLEVTSEERVSMLDELIPDWSDEAKASMQSLNSAIKSPEIGLSRAYEIGPSYYCNLTKYEGDFECLWKYHIEGLICEYLRGTRDVEKKVEILKAAFDKRA